MTDRDLALAAARGVGIEVLAFARSGIPYPFIAPGEHGVIRYFYEESGVIKTFDWQINWQCAGVLLEKLKQRKNQVELFIDFNRVCVHISGPDADYFDIPTQEPPRAVFKACAKLEGV